MKSDGSMPPCRSAVVIARALCAEGFSPTLANMVRKYWMRRLLHGDRIYRVMRTVRAFKDFALRLTDTDKIVMGKFIGLRMKQAFDAGLRVGLGCSIVTPGDEVPVSAPPLSSLEMAIDDVRHDRIKDHDDVVAELESLDDDIDM